VSATSLECPSVEGPSHPSVFECRTALLLQAEAEHKVGQKPRFVADDEWLVAVCTMPKTAQGKCPNYNVAEYCFSRHHSCLPLLSFATRPFGNPCDMTLTLYWFLSAG